MKPLKQTHCILAWWLSLALFISRALSKIKQYITKFLLRIIFVTTWRMRYFTRSYLSLHETQDERNEKSLSVKTYIEK